MIEFNHSGTLGDVLFSMYFCKELGQTLNKKIIYHLQINKSANLSNHPFKNVSMNEVTAKMLEPLFCSQKYIFKYYYSDDIPDNTFNLDNFRNMTFNISAGDIRSYYYNLCNIHLNREFWKPIFDVNTDQLFNDKILLISTTRYQNVLINYNLLKDFKNFLIFIGTEDEHKNFCHNYFNVEYYKIENFREIAEKMMGSIGVIGNQSGLYSLAECIKCNRILVAPEFVRDNNKIIPGPHNNHPCGGWNEDVLTNEKLISSVKNLLSYRGF